MNWKLFLIASILVFDVSGRPADEIQSEPSSSIETKSAAKLVDEITNLTEKPTTLIQPQTTKSVEAVTKKTTEKIIPTEAATSTKASHNPTTTRYEEKSEEENRELKTGSNLNVNSELTIKESFHHGVAVPMSIDDYEKELAREKDLVNKAKKKISMESSTPKEGISTWILLSGSSDLKTSTTTNRPEVNSNKPAYRNDNTEKKNAVKNNISNNSTATTKKRIPVTQSPKTPKPTQKTNNKLVTRVKVSSSEEKITTEAESSTVAHTTKKAQLTTKAKKYTTTKPKTTVTTAAPTKKTTTTTTSTFPPKLIDDSMVIDDEKDEVEPIETSTYLIMEAKDDEFNLPNDRAPIKSSASKKTSSKNATNNKTKKKKIPTTQTALAEATNSTTTKIKKKSDKTKTGVSKITKKPEKPITTQIYNYLAREVMPTVGVGLVGLVVTAGLATYFLGGPLTALRRSYDIASRRDDVAYDRSDDFGNMQDEGEMFGKVIAGMPENSAYRNNIRVNSYRVKSQPQYTPGTYPAQQQYTHVSKYGLQAQPVQSTQQTQQQQQYLRYRAADPYYNSYSKNQYTQQNQYYQQQQMQAKSNDYASQSIQSEAAQKFNIDVVDMTTSEPSSSSYSMDYDEIAQSYFPQPDQSEQQQQQQQMTIEQQNIQEIESKSQPQYVQPTQGSERSEKVTIVNAQSVVPQNHKVENDASNALPTPEALKMTSFDDEYQNSIANAILNQNQKQQKQFVVGTSIVAENFEDNAGSSVPEHGPRRRRKREAKKPAAKSLENNEIDEDENVVDKNKRQTENATEEILTTTTVVLASESTKEISTSELENETTTPSASAETTTTIYDINGGNNVFQLFRRIIELKLRLGLNFLQNATLAFQEYLRGVEERVQTSPLFNPYANHINSTQMSRKASKINRKKVENL